MKTLKESLLDIDGTIKRSSEAAAEEGIRIFIKKLFFNKNKICVDYKKN